jgi:hypothetical protein
MYAKFHAAKIRIIAGLTERGAVNALRAMKKVKKREKVKRYKVACVAALYLLTLYLVPYSLFFPPHV